MSNRKALWVLALAGCGGSDQSVTVGTSASTGSVGGVVLDAGPGPSGMGGGLGPLGGAAVTVIAGGATFSATSDANGTFAVKDVPSGSVVVKIQSADHFDVYLTGVLAANAGNFPVSNAALTVGPIAMVSNKGSLSVRLVDENGAPAPNVRVTARAALSYLDLSGGTVSARGAVDSSTLSTADGTATLPVLPDFAAIGPLISDQVTLNVPPIKLSSGSDGYQFLGLTVSVNATQYQGAFSQTPTIVLAGPRTPLTPLSSNVDWFETCPMGACGAAQGPVGPQVDAAGTVTVAFNQAVDPASLRTTLLTEYGAAAAMAMPTVSGNLVTVSFARPLDVGSRYNLVFHADSVYRDQPKEYNATAPFFVPTTTGTAVTVLSAPSSRIDPNNPNDFIITFSEPIGVGFGSTAQVPCVVYYETSLDGDANTTTGGEWNAGGNNLLKCDPFRGGLILRPDEPQIGATAASPTTGFTTRWRLAVRPPSLCINGYLCSVSQVTVHLVFSRNTDPNAVVKRSNGQPVSDLSFILPTIP